MFQFVMAWSGWPHVALAFGETYQALVSGLQGRLAACAGASGSTTCRRLLFADLVGYTALTAPHGDIGAAAIALTFHDHSRRYLSEHAELVKTNGAAVMAVAPSLDDGPDTAPAATAQGPPRWRSGQTKRRAVGRMATYAAPPAAAMPMLTTSPAARALWGTTT
jgi:class 3 adenylate cyclase